MTMKLDPRVKVQRARSRRNDRITKLRERRLSLREIGETVGLTGPRVYKILKQSGKEHTFYKTPRMSFTGAQAVA